MFIYFVIGYLSCAITIMLYKILLLLLDKFNNGILIISNTYSCINSIIKNIDIILQKINHNENYIQQMYDLCEPYNSKNNPQYTNLIKNKQINPIQNKEYINRNDDIDNSELSVTDNENSELNITNNYIDECTNEK